MSADESVSPYVALVARAVAGDATALRTLHDEHRAPVHRIARSYAELDADEVEDVVQETFVRAFRNLAKLREPRLFQSWILTIARNTALTRITRRRSEQETAADAARETVVQGLTEVHLPDLEAELEIELVRKIIAELPEGTEKETVRLFYLEGELSARDIAERFGVGKSAITMRLERFRAKVRRRILAEVAALRGRESED